MWTKQLTVMVPLSMSFSMVMRRGQPEDSSFNWYSCKFWGSSPKFDYIFVVVIIPAVFFVFSFFVFLIGGKLWLKVASPKAGFGLLTTDYIKTKGVKALEKEMYWNSQSF